MMVADPNLKDFQGRLRRIEKAHRKGYGFEAAGAPGRSANYRRERTLGRRLRNLGIVLMMALVLKAAIVFNVGEEAYQTRLAAMETGSGFDPLAARLMTVDPVTRLIAGFIGQVFPQQG